MPSYPAAIKQWTPVENRVDIVQAQHVDDLQDEVFAVQSILGANPHISGIYAGATTVGGRMTILETNVQTVEGYFGEGGSIGISQVRTLQSKLDTIADNLNTKASQASLDSLTGVVSTKAAQSSLDSVYGELNGRINDLAVVVSALTTTVSQNRTYLEELVAQEAYTRSEAVFDIYGAISSEAYARYANDIQLYSETAALRAMFKAAESQYINTANKNYSPNVEYQAIQLPTAAYATNDYGNVNGHGLVGLVSNQPRFYTDFPSAPSLWAGSLSVTYNTANNQGTRGVQMRTIAGSSMCEFSKNANQDTTVQGETVSVAWVGRLAVSAGYYVSPYHLYYAPSSAGQVTVQANGAKSPTGMFWSRIPG